jgi:hypothetical protein
MLYEDEKKNDQIAVSAGKRGASNSQRCITGLLSSLLATEIHSASTVYHPRIAAVSQDRLQGDYPNAERLLRSAQTSGSKEGSTLLYSVLCREKAHKKRAFEILLKAIFDRARAMHLLDKAAQGAIDATGLESRYTSQHYIQCTKRSSFYRRKWPKMTIVCHTKTHLIAGCIVTRGPSLDFPILPKVMKQTDKQLKFDQILADAGYDSEANHYEVLGIRSTVIAYNSRGAGKPPIGKYRLEMSEDFDKKSYNNRWQVESVFSRHKRLLGSALRNRSQLSRERECLVRVLTHNLMIIRRAA